MRALILAGSVLVSVPAFACINGMNEEEQRPSMDLVARAAGKKLQQKDYQGAAKDAQRVLSSSEAGAGAKKQARRTLGVAKLRLGDLSGAVAALQQALLDSPDEPALLARLGEAEAGLGRNADA